MELRQNRIQSFAFVISMCAAFCFASNLMRINPASGAGVIHLNNRINPNTAPVESLVRLPDIGITRAEAIIEYRESYRENNNHVQAFENSDDLQNIKGIGPKIVQNMSQWLKFN